LSHLLTSEMELRPPQPDCAVCGVARATVLVDPARATLGNLVDDVLRKQLGYGEEFSVLTKAGVIYEPDYTDSVTKKFAEIDLHGDNFMTIQDDDEDTPRVNLIIAISEKTLSGDDSPIQLMETPKIPKKPKAAPEEIVKLTNGEHTNGTSRKLKRSADDAGLEDLTSRKRGKMPSQPGPDDDLIILDDTSGGAIIIEDD